MSNIIKIEHPVRIEHVLVTGSSNQVRDSLQNITVTHKSLIDIQLSEEYGRIRHWYFMGDTDNGMGVGASCFSDKITDFTQLKWKIAGGVRISKDIYIDYRTSQ